MKQRQFITDDAIQALALVALAIALVVDAWESAREWCRREWRMLRQVVGR